MSKSKRGFTLIELMIVVAIIGILAAIALPAFTSYIRRAKTSEAANNLKALFTGAASYYMREGTGQGVGSTSGGTACMAEDATSSNTPGVNKGLVATWNNGFVALNFGPADPIYYQYEIYNGNGSTASACGVTAGDTTVYSFRARGNLDGDTTTSTFELSVGSNSDNELYRAPGFYIVQELE